MTAIRDRLPVLVFYLLANAAVLVPAVVLSIGGADFWRAWVAYAAGGLIPVLYRHPFRVLGFIPPAVTAIAVGLTVDAATGDYPGWALALPAGLWFVAGCGRLRAAHPQYPLVPAWVIVAFAIVPAAIGWLPGLPPRRALPAFAGLVAAVAWWALFRPFFELACEPVIALMYRVRGTGPGLAAVPARGPCLVIGNHACWADPFLLAKVLPRPITPVMTSQFYDLPVIRWLMRRVIKAIRVPEKALKQDVPQEIQEVIAALDRGECVVLFPEGYLRRSDDRPLRRFGRGVWQVLSARPDTPVFPCWIEGGWGSYTSYKNGLPTKNKRPDFRRRIGVAVDGPLNVAPDVLAGHLVTRVDLMNRVAAARKWLGLPDLPAYELPKAGEEGEG